MKEPSILVIIPARGGSKGIPRKNLRPLHTRPLIYYAIHNALSLPFSDVDCYVSSEDEEILAMSSKFGARTHLRPKEISEDAITLDPVIHDAFQTISKKEGKDYDLVITLQPTSPLLEVRSIASAIEKLQEENLDTLISGTYDTHLTWTRKGGAYYPNYEKRVNRQQLPETYKETGGFVITRSRFVTPGSRFGAKVEIFPLPKKESIDIDDFEDWSLCEFYLKQKKILFVVTGNSRVGMGHVYNTLSVAHEILNHQVEFLVDHQSDLAAQKIGESNYRVHHPKHGALWESVLALHPDVVINDRLDTPAEYMQPLREAGCTLINFEDIGPGAALADLVINAMYPEGKILANHYFGAKYFILKDEFLFTPNKVISPELKRVLISFGGVDPNNFTLRVMEILSGLSLRDGTELSVVVGMGYPHTEDLRKRFPGVEIQQNIKSMSELIYQADLVFTSAGRTTFEVASIGTPAIVLCQNKRETTHFFASEKNGFYNLGLGAEVSDDAIKEAFLNTQSFENRKLMNERMLANNLKRGKERVLKLLLDTIAKKYA